jgi:hypothetical protein
VSSYSIVPADSSISFMPVRPARGTRGGVAGAIRSPVEQVAPEEGQFGLGSLPVTGQERLVVPTGQVHQLTEWCAGRRADSGFGKSGLVLVADQDQEGAPHLGRIAAGPVEAGAQCRAGGDRLLPVRVGVTGVERAAACKSVGGRQDGNGSRLTGQRHQPRRAADQATGGVEGH